MVDANECYSAYGKKVDNNADAVIVDSAKWRELLAQLSEKLAQTFALKSIEIIN
jgi:hypothetical protein